MKVFRNKKQQLPTLDDIVFEHRNKEYGCYYLRSTYPRRLQFSFFLVLILFLISICIYYLREINPLNNSFDISGKRYSESVLYNPEIIPIILQLPGIPKDKQILLVESTEQSYSAKQLNSSRNLKKVQVEVHKPVPPVIDTSYKKILDKLLQRQQNNLLEAKSKLNDTISIILDKEPEFPGGYSAVQAFFYRNQLYPKAALLTGIRGSTIVSFVINESGFVEDAKVVSGIDPQLDMEAIRLVKAMPPWKPAYYKGKPISCMLIMPVNFIIR